ncbi:hypothetical protein [Altererythrobacter sp. ZODW24]|uniref:hypothetical protein n=1 Tax=Altererythrobacter sp. ZODW24 TaxID=2185142 RepID=UPI000DF86205|nr:hypothetical protein [Altererythrobacter sp. ZODW24]
MRHLILLLIASLFAASPSVSATAQSLPTYYIWQTSEGEMKMPSGFLYGSEHTIPYRQDGGRIIGKFSLREDDRIILQGHWIEDSSSTTCSTAKDGSRNWGRITFTFDKAFQYFEGAWGYCEASPASSWTGRATSVGGHAYENRPAYESASLDRVLERLRTEGRRAGPQPAGSSIDYSDADLAKLRTDLLELGMMEDDMEVLVDDYWGSGEKIGASKWDKFLDYAKRRSVAPDQQRAARRFEQGLRDYLGLPQEATDYLRQRFFSNDGLRDDLMSQVYGAGYHNFALTSLANDPKLLAMMDARTRARVEDLATPEPEGDIVRARGPGDTIYDGPDCSYNAVLARMKAADPSFAIKWDIHVNYGSAMGSVPGVSVGNVSDTMRRRLRAGHLEAMRQCEKNRGR